MNKSLIVSIICFLSTIPLYANVIEADGIIYEITSEIEKTVKVSRYVGSEIDVYIPDKIMYHFNTYTVTAIDERAFYNCNYTTSIEIPYSVTLIWENAFQFCFNLSNIIVDKENPLYTSFDGVLYSKTNGKPDILIICPEGKTSIDIPNSVTSISKKAFFNSSITSINIPNSVTSICESAFYGCHSLSSIEIPSSVTSIGANAFSNSTSLTSVVIPNSVTSIRSGTFNDCRLLTSVVIPNSVTSIGVYAFSNCTSLTSVVIPNSVTSIGAYAFSNCTSLTSVVIPNSVTSIGISAFQYCDSLKSLTIPNSVTYIGDYAFQFCISLTSILIPNSVSTINEFTFCGCNSLTSVDLPNSVNRIDKGAFKYCSSMTSLVLPNSITSIREDAFYGCDSLEKIYCNWESPISIQTYSIFEMDVYKNAILYIPYGTTSNYKKIGPWWNFWNIEEYDTSNVDDVIYDTLSPSTVYVYNIDGKIIKQGCEMSEIKTLPKGIYIIVSKRGSMKIKI